MRTTVVVVTWRGAAHIDGCLDALAAQDRPHRTLVVDNAADDATAARLAAREAAGAVEVLRLPVNTGYAGGLAAALSRVDTELVAWLNDDAAPEPGWLAACEDVLDAAPAAAAVTARLVRQDGTVQSTGVGLDTDGYGGDLTSGAAPFGFCGGAAVLRTGALRAVGGVPAEFFCYYEDTDTAWRLRLAGWDIAATVVAVRHAHGASSAIGSPSFHRWNERNRLAMLARCAPVPVLLGQLVKFVLLLLRRTPDTPNYAPRLRLRVLAELAGWAPRLLRERRAVRCAVGRTVVWRRWAGSLASTVSTRDGQDGLRVT